MKPSNSSRGVSRTIVNIQAVGPGGIPLEDALGSELELGEDDGVADAFLSSVAPPSVGSGSGLSTVGVGAEIGAGVGAGTGTGVSPSSSSSPSSSTSSSPSSSPPSSSVGGALEEGGAAEMLAEGATSDAEIDGELDNELTIPEEGGVGIAEVFETLGSLAVSAGDSEIVGAGEILEGAASKEASCACIKRGARMRSVNIPPRAW
jgi:hypothetical protein